MCESPGLASWHLYPWKSDQYDVSKRLLTPTDTAPDHVNTKTSAVPLLKGKISRHVKLSVCLNKNHVIKRCGGGVAPHILISALDGNEWLPSRLDRFTPGISWIRSCVGIRVDLDVGKTNCHCSCGELNCRHPAYSQSHLEGIRILAMLLFHLILFIPYILTLYL